MWLQCSNIYIMQLISLSACGENKVINLEVLLYFLSIFTCIHLQAHNVMKCIYIPICMLIML